MFETNEQLLEMLRIYSVAGFLLAVPYNIFRFVRLAFPGLKTVNALLDFLFPMIAGVTLFILSVPYGTGFFRLYYVFAAAFGFAVNMLTAGLAVPPLARPVRALFRLMYDLLLRAARSIMLPIRLFCQKIAELFIKTGEIIVKIAENCGKYLQFHRKKVYNKNDNIIGEVSRKGGERGNGIKAKIRKIG